ncbi:MAG: EAL domain-containing protein [Campylobacterales bacterium]|nr:EAL domain-containing protein [Campylobacterales bacterium]
MNRNAEWVQQLEHSSHIGILIVDVERKNLFVNQRLCDMFGYTKKELLALDAKVFHVDTTAYEKFGEIAFKNVLNGKSIDIDYEFKRKDGSLFWAHISGDPVHNKNEVLWTLVDITLQREAQKESFDRLALLDSVMNATPDFIFYKNYLDENGSYMDCNEAFANFVGKTKKEIIGKRDVDLFGTEVGEFFYQKDLDAMHEGQSKVNEEWLTYPNGKKVLVQVSKTPFHNAQNEMVGVVGIAHDITALHKSREALDEKQQYMQRIIDGVHDPIMVIKDDYTVELMNEALKRGLQNKNIADMNAPKCYEIGHNRSTPCDGLEHPCPLREVLGTQSHAKVIHKHFNAEGEERFVELYADPLLDKEGRCVGIIESTRDITEHMQTQDALLVQKNILDYQAHHDSLTKLPNRVLFEDRLHQALEKSKRNASKTALFFIDLDHFKEINDSLGHLAGDEVLKAVAKRLKRSIREEDTLARLGGDEFTVVLEGIRDAHDVSNIAKNILNALSQPMLINDSKIYVSSSIGISLYPDDGGSVQNLIKFADSAMYKAKSEGRNNFQYYNEELTELAFERVFMEASLREALDRQEFVVFYQPQIDARVNRLIGMEALVRWNHPNMGMLSPAKFISLAERTGLIVDIDRLVMKQAMSQISQWYEQGYNPGVLALNLSVKQLEQKDFFESIARLFQETGCKPEWIEFEVTEGQVMTHPEESIEILKRVNALGIELAIDDFGTGYSSLSYLKKLPIDKLKIDQAFIRDLPDDEEDAAITRAVIALAKSLNLKIIAEGVEYAEQKDFVLEHGCNYIQGYFYSKPVDAKAIEGILKKGNNL